MAPNPITELSSRHGGEHGQCSQLQPIFRRSRTPLSPVGQRRLSKNFAQERTTFAPEVTEQHVALCLLAKSTPLQYQQPRQSGTIRRPTRRTSSITRIRLPTPTRNSQRGVVDSRIESRSAVRIPTTSKRKALAFIQKATSCSMWKLYPDPPLALLNQEQMSCEKQSCVYAFPRATPEQPAPQRPLQLYL